MTPKALNVLIVGATGGLGQCLTREALQRGHAVSVFVRSVDKLNQYLSNETSRLASTHTGSATDKASLLSATNAADVILNVVGYQPAVAAAVASAGVESKVHKLVHVAGASNVLSEDGSTLNWKVYEQYWPGAERAFKVHQAGIDAIRKSGINHVIFCPGFMKSVGHASVPPVQVRVNRPSGDFVSYEDAAAAERSDWDGKLITAATVANSELMRSIYKYLKQSKA
ncbi:hypothetical protein HDU98_009702 [Podochytrium sp. JEL0797]|nr:hypothetical protein HDU98_009702 [Podochytrium sp. JEL0797]